MKDIIVTTFDGTKTKRSKCRYIKGKLYEINRQCFKVNGEWHRINNGKITLNYEDNHYVLKRGSELGYGIVGRNDDNSFKYGYFSPNITKNVQLEILKTDSVNDILLDEDKK